MNSFVGYMIQHPPIEVESERFEWYEGYCIPYSCTAFYDVMLTIDYVDYPDTMMENFSTIEVDPWFRPTTPEIPVMRLDQCQYMALLQGVLMLLQYNNILIRFNKHEMYRLIHVLIHKAAFFIKESHSIGILNVEKYRIEHELESGEIYAVTSVLFLAHVESIFREIFEILLRANDQTIQSNPRDTSGKQRDAVRKMIQDHYIGENKVEQEFFKFRLNNGLKRLFKIEFGVVKLVSPIQLLSYLDYRLSILPTVPFTEYQLRDYVLLNILNENRNFYYCGVKRKWILKPQFLEFDFLFDLVAFTK